MTTLALPRATDVLPGTFGFAYWHTGPGTDCASLGVTACADRIWLPRHDQAPQTRDYARSLAGAVYAAALALTGPPDFPDVTDRVGLPDIAPTSIQQDRRSAWWHSPYSPVWTVLREHDQVRLLLHQPALTGYQARHLAAALAAAASWPAPESSTGEKVAERRERPC